MNIRLDGKVILVTGSTQGVGEATARLAAESGAAAVMITGRDAGRGGAVADEIAASGATTSFVAADLTDRRAGSHRLRPHRVSAGSTGSSMRRSDRSRFAPRRLSRVLGPDVRRQRSRAVLPHAALRRGHAQAEITGRDRERALRELPLRRSLARHLFGLKGALAVLTKRRQRPCRRSDPGEWHSLGVDRYARRAEDAGDHARSRPGLARARQQRAALRQTALARGRRKSGGVPPQRRRRPHDRRPDRSEPTGRRRLRLNWRRRVDRPGRVGTVGRSVTTDTRERASLFSSSTASATSAIAAHIERLGSSDPASTSTSRCLKRIQRGDCDHCA